VNSLILRAGTRILVGLLLVFSVFMLLRGHNEPGGGFIGGLLGATAFIVYGISAGTAAARTALRVRPSSLAMVGVGIALFAGILPAFFGDGFFTGQWAFLGEPTGPDDKGLPVSSVLVFDIGVYLVVMGAVSGLAFALEEEV